MISGARISDLAETRGLSQSELARRVGVSQASISKLARGVNKIGSRHLHSIARELGTTPAYLVGDTDDPDANAPPPPLPARHQLVTMQVALPSESVLARMFEGLLASLTGQGGLANLGAVDQAALARELATLLPIGLGQLRGPLRVEASASDDAAGVPPQDQPIEHREPRRARRT